MATIVSKNSVMVDYTKIENQTIPVIDIVTTKTENTKYAAMIVLSDGTEHLIIVEGILDNGSNRARTPLTHFIKTGDIWERKSQNRLDQENSNIVRFVKEQGYEIWTQIGKFVTIVNNKPKYLDPITDKDEIYNKVEVLDENGNSFEPKQYEYTTVKQGVMDAYLFNEEVIRPSQVNAVLDRYPSVGQELTF